MDTMEVDAGAGTFAALCHPHNHYEDDDGPVIQNSQIPLAHLGQSIDVLLELLPILHLDYLPLLKTPEITPGTEQSAWVERAIFEKYCLTKRISFEVVHRQRFLDGISNTGIALRSAMCAIAANQSNPPAPIMIYRKYYDDARKYLLESFDDVSLETLQAALTTAIASLSANTSSLAKGKITGIEPYPSPKSKAATPKTPRKVSEHHGKSKSTEGTESSDIPGSSFLRKLSCQPPITANPSLAAPGPSQLMRLAEIIGHVYDASMITRTDPDSSTESPNLLQDSEKWLSLLVLERRVNDWFASDSVSHLQYAPNIMSYLCSEQQINPWRMRRMDAMNGCQPAEEKDDRTGQLWDASYTYFVWNRFGLHHMKQLCTLQLHQPVLREAWKAVAQNCHAHGLDPTPSAQSNPRNHPTIALDPLISRRLHHSFCECLEACTEIRAAYRGIGVPASVSHRDFRDASLKKGGWAFGGASMALGVLLDCYMLLGWSIVMELLERRGSPAGGFLLDESFVKRLSRLSDVAEMAEDFIKIASEDMVMAIVDATKTILSSRSVSDMGTNQGGGDMETEDASHSQPASATPASHPSNLQNLIKSLVTATSHYRTLVERLRPSLPGTDPSPETIDYMASMVGRRALELQELRFLFDMERQIWQGVKPGLMITAVFSLWK
ncbi:hypothetical protein HDU96_005524 [Phlyctochytrium bullatum]|nr:hypothetical protein HDU96_005524 [Phlyctochytrium bullatum]